MSSEIPLLLVPVGSTKLVCASACPALTPLAVWYYPRVTFPNITNLSLWILLLIGFSVISGLVTCHDD